jgi:hypothetical protein
VQFEALGGGLGLQLDVRRPIIAMPNAQAQTRQEHGEEQRSQVKPESQTHGGETRFT